MQILSVSLLIHFLINSPVSSKGKPNMNISDLSFMCCSAPAPFWLQALRPTQATNIQEHWLMSTFAAFVWQSFPSWALGSVAYFTGSAPCLKDIRKISQWIKPGPISVCCRFHVRQMCAADICGRRSSSWGQIDYKETVAANVRLLPSKWRL